MAKQVLQLSAKEIETRKKKLAKISATEKMKAMYSYRFGIDDGITHSNAETGRKFGVTREAVRQTVAKIEACF